MSLSAFTYIYNVIYKAITNYNLFISLFTLLHSLTFAILTAAHCFLFYSYHAAKIFYLYCLVRTTFVRHTLCEVSQAFCERGLSHTQTADKCVHHCPLDSKDFCRHCAKEDLGNGSY